MTKLEIGGGKNVREGWLNLDCYAKTADIKLDLRACLAIPLADNSINKVFSSHCIEHINDLSAIHLFKELYRTTKSGAILRFSCPDGDLIYNSYGEGNLETFKVFPGASLEERFINWLVSYENQKGVPGVNPETVKKYYNSMSKERFLEWAIETHLDTKRPYIAHCNWFNEEKLTAMLADAGFINIKRSEAFKSEDAELRKGFDSHLAISIFMECGR